MTGFRLLLGRRHFLASTLVGAFGACVPLTPAHAQTVPPAPVPETLARPASAAPPATAIIGAAATAAAVLAEPGVDRRSGRSAITPRTRSSPTSSGGSSRPDGPTARR